MTRLLSFPFPFPLRRMAVAIGAVMLAAVGVSPEASAQDAGAAVTREAITKDTIFARKVLMDTINNNMDELETMIASGKIDLSHGREHAQLISAMLLAFPHLFPADTNHWKPNVDRDAGRDTYAAPEVFTKYADFYAQATNASQIAGRAGRAKQESDFNKYVLELRTACNSCHEAYLKTDQ